MRNAISQPQTANVSNSNSLNKKTARHNFSERFFTDTSNTSKPHIHPSGLKRGNVRVAGLGTQRIVPRIHIIPNCHLVPKQLEIPFRYPGN